jgi:glycosyltransferase involved in cell wall biosynthesis
MTVFGMLRIRNEGRWIRAVIEAALPLCERIFILDDHSTDATPELCAAMGEKVTVINSNFDGFDESRDREYLLSRLLNSVGDNHLCGDVNSPFWALAIDGDELLDGAGVENIRATLQNTEHHAFKLPIRYLWNSDLSLVDRPGYRTVRVDGVYRHFARPSVFRLMNRNFRFQRTPFGNGKNFHCSSIPQELLHAAHVPIPGAPLWHLGYNDRDHRVKKFHWYNKLDPNNEAEDGYRHMVLGDIAEVPSDATCKHAGPLQLEMM